MGTGKSPARHHAKPSWPSWHRTLLFALCAGSALTLLIGCSSTQTISSDDAAQQISDVLEDKTGQRPDEVACPEDLEAEVGATMRCELTDGEATYGVTVRITDVTDGVATFDIDVDTEPL